MPTTQRPPITQAGPVPRRPRSEGAPTGSTTIRVSNDTKRLLDQLLSQTGDETFDAMIRSIAARELQPGLDLDFSAVPEELGGDLAAIVRQAGAGPLQDFGSVLEKLRGLLTDPDDGRVFRFIPARHRHGVGRLPIPHPEGHDLAGLVRRYGWADNYVNERESDAGAWVEAPSGCYLTERDGTLPEGLVADVRELAESAEDSDE